MHGLRPYDIIFSMAVRAKKPTLESTQVSLLDPRHPDLKKAADERRHKLQIAAAKLYGRGLSRTQVAQALRDHLSHSKLPEARHRNAMAKLGRWELTESFRDMVYQHAVVKLDMATPGILQGLGRRARRGRVDAARLALELTGRHVPKGDSHPTQIVLAMGNIPRPVDVDLAMDKVQDLPELEDEDVG